MCGACLVASMVYILSIKVLVIIIQAMYIYYFVLVGKKYPRENFSKLKLLLCIQFI